jgi:ABC-type phosphate transport system substrate-binding protein
MRILPKTLRFLLAAVLSAPTFVLAEIAVIVHPTNPVKQMTVQQVYDLYLGRARNFPGGEFALVFDLPRDDALREKFFQSLAGMSPQQVNAYWSRLMFTGQVLPPQPMPNDRAVLDIVRRNPGAVGYVKAEGIDNGVRVVLTLKE